MKIKRTFAIGFFAKKLLSEKMKMRNYKHTQAYLNGISKKNTKSISIKKRMDFFDQDQYWIPRLC